MDTASWIRRYWQEIGLGLFWFANLAVLWNLYENLAALLPNLY